MKNIKKIAVFSLLMVSFLIGAMEAPLKEKKEEVLAAQKPKMVDFNVEEFKPNRDKKEVFQLVKDAWPTNLGGEYDENFTSAHLINPVHPGSVFKYVDVARNAQAAEGSKIVGVATSLMFFKSDENPKPRANVEILLSKSSLSEAERIAIEKALLIKALDNIRPHGPEVIDKQLRETNKISIQGFKDAGFEEKRTGKDKFGNTWVVLETK